MLCFRVYCVWVPWNLPLGHLCIEGEIERENGRQVSTAVDPRFTYTNETRDRYPVPVLMCIWFPVHTCLRRFYGSPVFLLHQNWKERSTQISQPNCRLDVHYGSALKMKRPVCDDLCKDPNGNKLLERLS